MSHHLFGSCKNCGEAMEGDGYSVVLHCPDAETDYSCLEPDANPVYCNSAEDNDDLSVWKRRALLAESRVREQDKIIDRMGQDLNAINGPTFMGEPVLPKRQPTEQLVEALVACARASSAAEVGLIVDAALAAYRLQGGSGPEGR